ncbi:hypothetical protein TNCV_12491 [Trichonephila clavipes]|nr:hypothetical protein TNCV_12491 [Trichonephila clavipes]
MYWPRPTTIHTRKAAFTPRLSASSVERLANQRLHIARDEVSDWLDAQSSTLTALGSKAYFCVGVQSLLLRKGPESQEVLRRPCRMDEDKTYISNSVISETATAVVQSGRPIFDDFFQHLWPYIGNNTANVVFQMVKRLWLIRIDQ